MSPEQKKNNSLRNLLPTLLIISLIIGFFVFFDNRIEKKIQSNPAVTRLEERYLNLDERLERMEKKIDKLLEAKQ